MKVAFIKVTADVSRLHQKERKVKWMSTVTIRLDGVTPIASTTVPGKCSEEWALAEFKKNPAKFLPHEPFDAATVVAIGWGYIKPYQVFSSTVEETPAVAA